MLRRVVNPFKLGCHGRLARASSKLIHVPLLSMCKHMWHRRRLIDTPEFPKMGRSVLEKYWRNASALRTVDEDTGTARGTQITS